MYRGVCMCILVYTNIYVCTWVYTYVSVCSGVCLVYIYIYLYVLVACCNVQNRLVRSGPLQETGSDLDSYHCGPNIMAIRRPIHEMIRKLVPVRAVKARRRFVPETESFHVSVRSCVFTIVGMLYMLHLSFHVTFFHILPV